jgi:aminopeptidase YwaD
MTVKKHLYHLAGTIGNRLIGTEGNARARDYIASVISELGCSVGNQRFERRISIPEGGYVRGTDDGRQFECWPCLGTPSFGPERCFVQDVGVGRRSDWERVDVAGKAALCERGELHDSVKVDLAAAKGAKAVLFFVDLEDCLYSTRASFEVAEIPAAVIRPSLARLLADRVDSTIELSITAAVSDVKCTNVWCDLGPEQSRRIVLCAHYDSRPFTPGANDNAGGAACLLELVRRLSNMPLRNSYRCIFFDGEEAVVSGSRAYVGEYGIDGVRSVVNIDAVGFGRSKVLLSDRDGPLSAGLAEAARKSAERRGLTLGAASSRTGLSDHAPFRNAGVADCLWISDHPNPGRETDLDVPDRIDTNHLESLAEVLVDLLEGASSRASH